MTRILMNGGGKPAKEKTPVTDADGQIIRLLTEFRDALREELAYRHKILDESLDVRFTVLQNGRARLVITKTQK